MWTKPTSSRLNGGCWSPVRMSVFFTVREDGVLDCWDILYNHNKPVLQVKIADHPLYAIKVNSLQAFAQVKLLSGRVLGMPVLV